MSKRFNIAFILLSIKYLSTAAGILTLTTADILQPSSRISTVVHNAPTAVSHQTFTRVHSNTAGIQPVLTSVPATTSLLTPLTATSKHSYIATAPAFVKSLTAPSFKFPTQPTIETHASAYLNHEPNGNHAAMVDIPIIKSETHTPAHLTYAASPVVYHMLPKLKPVHSISYDSLRPSPRHYEYAN